ncbi:MAG TPA: SusC/RagA family TonB-linked outer membrane protein [Bacteroidales bacterium]|nr:SusC/RagA family TonB-linked outer membrane protein [Bacteroidales bacterium]
MKKLNLLVVLFVLASFVLNAQTRVITGTVTSSVEGDGIPGVSVSAPGTTLGTLTDANGDFSIDVPQSVTTLVFSYIGMKKVEEEIAGRNVINVVMETDMLGLDEVVVTALGISREKKSLGYSTQQIGSEAISTVRTDNFVNSLSGKVSGINIRANNNMGGSTNIVIRGSKSLTGNNQALFVIDGVPVDNSVTNNRGQTTGRSGYDYGNTASDINPNDIESIDVLKGAAASALYGSRAANGVIMITTKKGEARTGKGVGVSINSNVTMGFIDMNTFPEHQTSYGAGYGPYYSGPQNRAPGSGQYPGLEEFVDVDGDGVDDFTVPFYEDASMGQKFDPSLMVYHWDAFVPESPNFLQKRPFVMSPNGPETFFDNSVSLTNSVDITGGTQVATFRMGYSNFDQKGIMPNSSLKRNNITFVGTYNIVENLKITASANYVNTRGKGRNETGYSDNIMSSFRQWYQVDTDVQLLKQLYEKTGRNTTWNPKGLNAAGVFNPTPNYWDNPYWVRNENFQTDERNRLIGFAQADWNATSWLSFMGRFAVDNYAEIQEERRAVGSVSGEFGVGRPEVTSGYSKRNRSYLETNFDFLANFNTNITEAFNLNAFVGTNIRRQRTEELFTSTNNGLIVPHVYALNNSIDPLAPPEDDITHIGINGFFGSASLGFNDMLYLDATYRIDQSSTLPKNNWTYFYPSISGSFLFSELFEDDWLELGKIRLNYAEVGNDAPFASTRDTYLLLAPFGGVPVVSVLNTKNNPSLKPERTKSIEGGLEMSFLNGRAGFDLALYKSNTINQIMPVTVSYATGYSAKYVNAGEIENKGVELRLSGSPVRIGKFGWDMTLNWSRNRNKVISLEEGIENLQIASLQGGLTINARVGEPYGSIQGTDYVYHNGQRVIGDDGYHAITSTSDVVIGNFNPDWLAGLQNTFSFGNLSLSFLIDMQKGGDIFSLDMYYGLATGLYPETVYTNDLGNPVRNPIVDANDDGVPDPESGGFILDGVMLVDEGNPDDPNDDQYAQNTTRIPGDDFLAFGYYTNPNKAFMYDASYVKLREVAITYSFPRSLFENAFIGGASLSLIGSNLWIIHKNLPYADPEANQGAGNIQGWQSGVMPTTRNFGFSLNVQF